MDQEKMIMTTNKFTSDQLREALFFMEEQLERCLCPFVLLGDLAKQIHDTPDAQLDLSEITLGIRKGEFIGSKSLRSIVFPYVQEEENYIHLEHKGVPISIRVLENDSPYFKNPNPVFYMISQFLLPNPFEEYWKKRRFYV